MNKLRKLHKTVLGVLNKRGKLRKIVLGVLAVIIGMSVWATGATIHVDHGVVYFAKTARGCGDPHQVPCP